MLFVSPSSSMYLSLWFQELNKYKKVARVDQFIEIIYDKKESAYNAITLFSSSQWRAGEVKIYVSLGSYSLSLNSMRAPFFSPNCISTVFLPHPILFSQPLAGKYTPPAPAIKEKEASEGNYI